MAHQFPTLYVREGIQDLAIPYCPDVFDPEQARPISNARQWINDFFDANTQKTRTENWGERTVVNLNPTLTLGIICVSRILPTTCTAPSGWTNTHEVASYARTAGPDLYPRLRIAEDRRRDVFEVVADDETLRVARSDEHAARGLVQTAMQAILSELGYGTPEEFAEKAMPLDAYQSERGTGPKLYVG